VNTSTGASNRQRGAENFVQTIVLRDAAAKSGASQYIRLGDIDL